ncbi:putative regulator of chromosome condensation 1/beta-lactamase-inhibitor protein II [Helianthus annuus]|nr:putative regulator of chromosome condensation 1/beta-lactamase-inhibitor protein II [Helianthus annuus]
MIPTLLGDVYIWGEVICDNVSSTRTDVLLPRPLEIELGFRCYSHSVWGRHAALVTRQGELFTWGEESGGRLGHGVGKDATQPHLVESYPFPTSLLSHVVNSTRVRLHRRVKCTHGVMEHTTLGFLGMVQTSVTGYPREFPAHLTGFKLLR